MDATCSLQQNHDRFIAVYFAHGKGRGHGDRVLSALGIEQ
jgi:hypothetical protein